MRGVGTAQHSTAHHFRRCVPTLLFHPSPRPCTVLGSGAGPWGARVELQSLSLASTGAVPHLTHTYHAWFPAHPPMNVM
jgi:hypothetical protein